MFFLLFPRFFGFSWVRSNRWWLASAAKQIFESSSVPGVRWETVLLLVVAASGEPEPELE